MDQQVASSYSGSPRLTAKRMVLAPLRRCGGWRRLAVLAGTMALAGLAATPGLAAPTQLTTQTVDRGIGSPSNDGIDLGLAFDYASHDLGAVSRNVSYIFGGYFVNWNFGFYPSVSQIDGDIPFDTDPYAQNIPGHNLSSWQATHPDWIVYQCDGKTPAYYGSGNTMVPLDFSNPAVRAWQLQQAAALFGVGATGIGFDDYTFANFENRCGVYRNGVWTPLGYPGSWQNNGKYTSDMMDWLRDMRAQLQQQFPTKTLTLNLAPSVSGLGNAEGVTPYIDMNFDEAGFTSYGGGKLSGSAWQQEVDALEYLASHGKAFDVNGIVGAADDASVTHDQINWVLANYLLVKGPRSYTYIYAGNNEGFTGSPTGYGTFYDRPEYHVPIGHPTSGRYQSQGVQMRNYSGGLAIVNPSGSQTYTVMLGATYEDVYGTPLTSVTLPPTTGIILLSEPTPAASGAGWSSPVATGAGKSTPGVSGQPAAARRHVHAARKQPTRGCVRKPRRHRRHRRQHRRGANHGIRRVLPAICRVQ